jgi:galactosylceramidase
MLGAPFRIDASAAPLGSRWQGVGAISGGGATSKLLLDYDPAVASDIFDFLFKPSFGASLDLLKVEVGGDADATEGAEPSHMHWRGDANYQRGYEWSMMKEARRRNPQVGLYGLSWSWPGWLAVNSTADTPPTPPDPQVDAAHDNATADYTIAFLEGAQKYHNLTMNYIGLWNEKGSTAAYVAALKARVTEKLPHIEIVGGPHYPGTKLVAQNCSAPGHVAWNATNWVDEEGSVADGYSSRCLARTINRGYLSGCYTGLFQWHLISSFYSDVPWPRCGLAVANQPWSGAYEITRPAWAVAHTTQFAAPGWRYLRYKPEATLPCSAQLH